MNRNMQVVGRWCIVVVLFAYGVVVLLLVGFFAVENITAVKARPGVYLTLTPGLFAPILAAIALRPRAKFKARARSRPRTADQIQEALVEVIRAGNSEYLIATYERICEQMHERHGFSEKRTGRALDAARENGRVQFILPYPEAKRGRGTRYVLLPKTEEPDLIPIASQLSNSICPPSAAGQF